MLGDNDLLKLNKSYILDESELLINNIEKYSRTPNNRFYTISSLQNQAIPVFDVSTNKIFKIFKISEDIADSLKIQSDTINYERFQKYDYITIRQLDSTIKSPPKKFLVNDGYSCSEFIDDSTICMMGKITFLRVLKGTELKTLTNFEYSSLFFINFINIFNNSQRIRIIRDGFLDKDSVKIYIQLNKLVIDRNKQKIYTIGRNGLSIINNITDRIHYPSISIMDYDGNIIRNYHHLPEEFLKYGLLYSINYKPDFCLDENSNLWIIYQNLNNIYKNDSIFTQIVNLAHKNDSAFWGFNEFKKNNNLQKAGELFVKKTAFQSENIFSINSEKIVALIFLRDPTIDTSSFEPYLYLIKDKTVERIFKIEKESSNGALRGLSYDNISNKLIIFRKNSENWTLEEYEI